MASRRRRGRPAGARRQRRVLLAAVLSAVLAVPLVGGPAGAQDAENDWDWLRQAYNASEPGPGGAASDVEISGSGLITWSIDRSQVDDDYTYFVAWASGTQQLRHAGDRRYFDVGDDRVDAGECPGGRCSLQIDDFDADLHYAADVTWLTTGWQEETATGRYAPSPRVRISATGEISWWKDRVPVDRQSYVLRWVSGDLDDPPRRVSKRGTGYGTVTVAETTCDAEGTCRAQIPDFDAGRAWLVDLRLTRSDDPWFRTYLHRWAGHWPAPDTDPGGSDRPTVAALSGLSVAAVDGDGTVLDVTWDAAEGAEHYLVAHRTASGTFGDGQQTTSTSYRISGLTAGTAYTVQVTAIDTDPDPDATVAAGEAQGRTWIHNTAPSFAQGAYQRSVAENTGGGTAIGAPVAASDADGDTLTYQLGGTGAGSFSIDTASGQIRTRSGVAYDYETRTSYTVTVTATDGLASASATVTIGIGDRSEPPRTPAAPTVASATTTSLRVTWNAPDNSGRPAISDYDVQYRAGSTGGWSTWAHTGTATTATITDLTTGTSYQVQVRATNADGTSQWSPAASGTPGLLVSNTGQPVPPGHSTNLGENDVAQSFTTGPAANGYTLTGVGIRFRTVNHAGASNRAAIYTDASGSLGTVVAVLTAPATLAPHSLNTFTHAGLDLSASTTYWVVLFGESVGANWVPRTSSDDEDAGAAPGWSIGDTSRHKSTSTWTVQDSSYQIQVFGAAKAAVALSESRSPADLDVQRAEVVITPEQTDPQDQADELDQTSEPGEPGESDQPSTSTSSGARVSAPVSAGAPVSSRASSSSGASSSSTAGGTVILANGWSPADVAVAAALSAGIDGSAVAYTQADTLAESTKQLLSDYRPAELIVVGGDQAVTPAVARAAQQVAHSGRAERIQGADRAATAAAAARHAWQNTPADERTAIIANGWSPADTAAAAALAARTPAAAVAFTAADKLPQATADLLSEQQPARIIVIGGTQAVAHSVAAAASTAAEVPAAAVTRLAGATRADTAAQIARRVLGGTPPGTATVVIANGHSPSDIGVAASAAARTPHAAVLYTAPGDTPQATLDLLRKHRPARVVIVGGAQAVSTQITDTIRTAVGSNTRVDRYTGTTRIHTSTRTAQSILGTR